MYKTASCIKLIQLLSSRYDFTSKDEIASFLEINPRNIREYIKEIEVAGYSVESKKGKFGGYRLVNRNLLPSLSLTPNEISTIEEVRKYIEGRDEIDYTGYSIVMGKILNQIDGDIKRDVPALMIDRFPLQMDKSAIEKRYILFSEAIKNLLEVEISYLNSNGEKKNYIIEPYRLFMFNNAYFTLAYDKEEMKMKYFKLNRINRANITKNHFLRLKDYDESKYLDEFGMKENGEYYHLKLEFTDLNVYIQERIYGKNQTITILDDNHLILECDMQNKNSIKAFVSSFRDKCKIIEPEWLIKDIKDEVWKVLALYD